MKKMNVTMIFLTAALLIGCQTVKSTEKMDSGMASEMKTEDTMKSNTMPEKESPMSTDMSDDSMKPKMMPEKEATMGTDMKKDDMKKTDMSGDTMKSDTMPEKSTMGTDMKKEEDKTGMMKTQ